MPGMVQNLGSGNPSDVERLSELPKPSAWTGALKWVIPALILGAFSIGFFNHQEESLEEMLREWILPNSISAALLTLLAGAAFPFFCRCRPPITSLNPLLGAGMVVGLLEAWLRKPTVEDAEQINEDVQSLKGLYKNKFTGYFWSPSWPRWGPLWVHG